MTSDVPASRTQPLVRDLIATLPRSFEAFHELNHLAYLRFAHAELGTREEAEEVVELAFTQLALNWTDVLSQADCEAFAWMVLKQQVGEYLVHRDRSRALVETAAFARRVLRASHDQFAELESRIGLYTAIAELPERQYNVILLRFVLGYPTDRTARIMGITEATVRSLVRLARRRLARELALDTSPHGEADADTNADADTDTDGE